MRERISQPNGKEPVMMKPRTCERYLLVKNAVTFVILFLIGKSIASSEVSGGTSERSHYLPERRDVKRDGTPRKNARNNKQLVITGNTIFMNDKGTISSAALRQLGSSNFNITFSFLVEENVTRQEGNRLNDTISSLENMTLNSMGDLVDAGDSGLSISTLGIESKQIGSCYKRDPLYNSCAHVESTLLMSHDLQISDSMLEKYVLEQINQYIEQFNGENDGVLITFVGPLHVSTKLAVELVGVPSVQMNPNQTVVFETILFDFLNEKLAEEAIVVRSIDVLYQTLSRRERRHRLRAADQNIERILNEANNKVIVFVSGEYTPPPDRDFDEVVSDAVNSNKEELKGRLKDTKDSYFEGLEDLKTETLEENAKPPTRVDESVGATELEDGPPKWAFITLGVSGFILVFGAVYSLCKYQKARMQSRTNIQAIQSWIHLRQTRQRANEYLAFA